MATAHHSEAQEAHAAETQALFREINERVNELRDGYSLVVPRGDWICECADDTCVERIELSVNEYESVRRHGARFIVAPGKAHVLSGVEHVVIDRTDRYWVIEEIGYAGEVARRSDPRSHRKPQPLRT